MTAIYYPEKQKITFLDGDGMPLCGFIGPAASEKTKSLIASGLPVKVIRKRKSLLITLKKVLKWQKQEKKK